MNSFQNMIGEALSTVRETAGVSVTYHRGASFVKLKAIPSRSYLKATNSQGVSVSYRTKDFIIKACELKLAGNEILPELEDTIKERVGDKVYEYEVRRPDGGSQVYKDNGGGFLSVLTQFKGIQDE